MGVFACRPEPAAQAEVADVPQKTACPADVSPQALAQGQKVYARVCIACHRNDGQGMPGIFPPLAHHAPRLAQTAAGRKYMAALVLWGVRGPLVVNASTYRNMMPPQASLLSDADIAAALTYVTYAWDNCRSFAVAPPFEAADVASLRQTPLSADAVFALRAVTAF